MAVRVRKAAVKEQPVNGHTKRRSRELKTSSHSRSVGQKSTTTSGSVIRTGTILIMALVAAYLHWHHLFQLFENDRHFSHMSSLEKEMAFRTEMGLYYSYFKTIIEAPSLVSGLNDIMNDRLTEYPLVINTLKRFNLYPEVVLGSWYRVYSSTMEFFRIPTKMCWSINRGEDLDPVESCEGLGDPAHFYVTFVFLLNGAMMGLFYIYGTYLSGSRMGGVVTVLCFFFNHGESTRVMWTPPLRESFSYPFLVLQMLLLTHILRTQTPSRSSVVALSVSIVLFMLPWQFAQFVLLTQVASLFGVYILGYLSPAKMQTLLLTHMVSLVVCFVLMFGNSMLLTSFYASSLLSIWGVVSLRQSFVRVFRARLVVWVMQGVAWLLSTVLLKFLLALIFGASDDAHISSLIKSKFTNYKDFDTMMYTCAAEFDFMEMETLMRYIRTLLLPLTLLLVLLITVKVIRDVVQFLRHQDGAEDEDHQKEDLEKSVMVYHTLQLVAFALLAVLIMRLKLFLTPHMCLMTSVLCSRQLLSWVGEKLRHRGVVVLLLCMMAVQGVRNLQQQWSIIGEFSNLPQEDLLEWITQNTPHNAVFAGAMPTMASVKLSAGRAIVNHPHYEDAGLRRRTKLVYSMYSRKPAEQVKQNLRNLKVDYFILEDSWCTRRTRPGCSMPEIWDLEDEENRGKVPLCSLLVPDSQPHFLTVFQNPVYKVLQVSTPPHPPQHRR